MYVKWFLRLHAEESGVIAAMYVIVVVLFLGIMAFTIDAGFWLLDRRGGQNQVDASVLAGVQTLPATVDNLVPAANDAQKWLESNSRRNQGQVLSECELDPGAGYVVLASPSTDPGSVFAFADRETKDNKDGITHYDTIRACIRRNGLVIFARVFDIAGVTVPAVAAASKLQEPVRYAIMAMDPSTDCGPSGDAPGALSVGGTAIVELGDGASYTATPCDGGLEVAGTSETHGGYHDICADTYTVNGGGVLDPPDPGQECDFPDPWENEVQPEPDFDNCLSGSFSFGNGDVATLPPGTYCDELRLNGDALITLEPGIHVFTEGITMTGGTLNGTDVLLYFTCSEGNLDEVTNTCAGATPGLFDVNGGNIDISALPCGTEAHPTPCPSVSQEPYIVVWFDRTAGEDAQAHIDWRGNGTVEVDGHIYDWNGTVELNGSDDSLNWSFDGTLLGKRIDFRGNATYNVNWNIEFAPHLPVISLVE